MNVTEKISALVDNKDEKFKELANKVWEFAETRFDEFRSADLLSNALEDEGFTLERDVAGLETGFIASFGKGKPVIGILGEYDALASLSQKSGSSSYDPVTPQGNGHGCGHNLLGVGSLAAAVAVKDYMETNDLSGTVKYFGCPAEESGYGKAFMAREGVFDSLDVAFSWHPYTMNTVAHTSSNAVIHATFTFKGRSAHAAAAPHLGRSALDAVELMNIGVNYMREHMIDDARVHYAVTNSGGLAPNVVQKEAEVTYLIRSPKPEQVQNLYKRVENIARGAALMTETELEHQIEGSCHNLIPNSALERVMHQQMKELGFPELDDQDIAFAKAIYHTFSDEDRETAKSSLDKEFASKLDERPIADVILPYSDQLSFMTGSTDVGNVSWNVPTAQCYTSTWAFATPFHTWQVVAQGKQNYAHQGMLLAGKTMACTAIRVLEDKELLSQAQEEFKNRLDGDQYESLIPQDLQPPRHNSPEVVGVE
ncbi:M20 family metallopeptidase [Lentibacillus sp. L22]|uniref:M20 family metallopeptidase n=1 Tax=Lentibacillus TaxID=175304 RepID=UPI0022B0A121|nr:M20 family metallopeptidase [Lentibacillus daqui]